MGCNHASTRTAVLHMLMMTRTRLRDGQKQTTDQHCLYYILRTPEVTHVVPGSHRDPMQGTSPL